jgi:hypothetical protein
VEVLPFWDQTPAETQAVMEAAIWQREQEQRRDLALAWHVAALTRTKTMPALKRLLAPPEARRLQGAELERRKREHEEMTRNLEIPNLNIAHRKRKDRA